MKKLTTVMALAVVLAGAVPAKEPTPMPNVPWGICEWCWWCIECYLLPVAASVDFEIQQTFNPF